MRTRRAFINGVSILVCLNCRGPDGRFTSSTELETEATCSWQAPEDLLTDTISAFQAELRFLSATEMRDHLACLGQIFEKHYIGVSYYDKLGMSLADRVDKMISEIGTPIRSDEFMHQLIALHAGAYDSHLRYTLVTHDNFPHVSADHCHALAGC